MLKLTRKAWFVVAGIAALAVVITLAAVFEGDTEWDSRERPDTLDGRRGFVRIISKDLPADSLWTEGARAQGLVLDVRECNMRTLSDFVQQGDIADRLYQFDFAYIRCVNGTRLDGPWAHR